MYIYNFYRYDLTTIKLQNKEVIHANDLMLTVHYQNIEFLWVRKGKLDIKSETFSCFSLKRIVMRIA